MTLSVVVVARYTAQLKDYVPSQPKECLMKHSEKGHIVLGRGPFAGSGKSQKDSGSHFSFPQTIGWEKRIDLAQKSSVDDKEEGLWISN